MKKTLKSKVSIQRVLSLSYDEGNKQIWPGHRECHLSDPVRGSTNTGISSIVAVRSYCWNMEYADYIKLL